MTQPAGSEDPQNPSLEQRLHKSLYGTNKLQELGLRNFIVHYSHLSLFLVLLSYLEIQVKRTSV